jgi:hypothetical protein
MTVALQRAPLMVFFIVQIPDSRTPSGSWVIQLLN